MSGFPRFFRVKYQHEGKTRTILARQVKDGEKVVSFMEVNRDGSTKEIDRVLKDPAKTIQTTQYMHVMAKGEFEALPLRMNNHYAWLKEVPAGATQAPVCEASYG